MPCRTNSHSQLFKFLFQLKRGIFCGVASGIAFGIVLDNVIALSRHGKSPDNIARRQLDYLGSNIGVRNDHRHFLIAARLVIGQANILRIGMCLAENKIIRAVTGADADQPFFTVINAFKKAGIFKVGNNVRVDDVTKSQRQQFVIKGSLGKFIVSASRRVVFLA